MVGTGRFELPTPRTPSECSTRLSHVPTGENSLTSVHERRAHGGHGAGSQWLGGTYSLGSAEPSPKKNSCICSTRNSCASFVQGCSRYSLSSIFCRSIHSDQAFLETWS